MAATADDMVEAIKQLNLSTNVLIAEERRQTEELKRANKRNANSGGGGSSGQGKTGALANLLTNYRNASGGVKAGIGQLAGGQLSGGLQSLMGASRAAAAAGPIGAAVAVTVGAALALNEFRKALDDATRSTIHNHREISKMSASMTTIFAQRDVKEMLRNMEKAERLAPATAELLKVEQERADAGKELDIALEEFKTGVLIEWNRVMRDFTQVAAELLPTLKQWMGIKDEERMLPKHLGIKINEALARKDQQKKAADAAMDFARGAAGVAGGGVQQRKGF